MSLKDKKYCIKWQNGVDYKGLPVKYQSLVELEKVPEAQEEVKYKCYHEWELYKGFLIAEKVCIKCKTTIILSNCED